MIDTINEKDHIFFDDGQLYSKKTDQFIGNKNKITGYWQCGYQGKTRYIHRLVWEKFVGQIPEGFEIDHKNNQKDDNRLSNLQLLSRSDNIAKQPIKITNSSGFICVDYQKSVKKWRSRVSTNSNQVYLGLFDTAELAARARDDYIIKNNLINTLNF